ncbi:MAG: acid phosphatase [Pseudomonas sp.]|uniref:metallophosphoesterase n=1 Tax=Pseudomonas sp. TaxID=306 RepID=UPI00260D122D|nr:metallophosphoesterase [Pseudomonas sp.]MDB6052452.1 acid phosphatase [Pseudomonas sp.]
MPGTAHLQHLPAVGYKRTRRWALIGAAIVCVAALAVMGSIFLPATPYTPMTGLSPSQVSLIAIGDQGSGNFQQWAVAYAMENVAETDGRLDMVVLLGDNFYGKSLTGTSDLSWRTKFESVYWGRWLSHVPFYAVLGNHDYPDSQQIEIEYSRKHKGSGRWQMPDHTYMRDFGTDDGRPVVRMVFIDTSVPVSELPAQIKILEQGFQQPGPEPIWRVVAGHHPVRNVGEHDEDSVMVTELLPVLRRLNVDLYLSGHDHNQQLILKEGEPAWVISGGGGQKLYPLKEKHSPVSFAKSEAGFAKLDFTPAEMKLAFYTESAGAAARYEWSRACPWMAKGCLVGSTMSP